MGVWNHEFHINDSVVMVHVVGGSLSFYSCWFVLNALQLVSWDLFGLELCAVMYVCKFLNAVTIEGHLWVLCVGVEH